MFFTFLKLYKWYQIAQNITDSYSSVMLRKYTNIVPSTKWKVSIFGVFLIRIFPHSDWIQRNTLYLIFFGIVEFFFFFTKLKKNKVESCATNFLIKLRFMILLIAAFSLIFKQKVTGSLGRRTVPRANQMSNGEWTGSYISQIIRCMASAFIPDQSNHYIHVNEQLFNEMMLLYMTRVP